MKGCNIWARIRAGCSGAQHRGVCAYDYTHVHTQADIHAHTGIQPHKWQWLKLPPRTMAFASTTKGIRLHNKRHLPTQPKLSTHALKGTWPHNQRHLPPQCKAFASNIHALEGICPYNQTHMPPQCQDILRGKAPYPAKTTATRQDTK